MRVRPTFVPTLYSHSRLNSFENCRKQFEFRYVLKIPSETEGIEAFVGKRVHEILERLYEFIDRGQVPSVEKVVQRYHALWDETYDAERVRIVREGVELGFYRDMGERCLRNYYRRHYPFDAGETLGLEERVIFDLDTEGLYRMQGIVDRISRAPDGVVEIHDYKTGSWVPKQEQLDADRQLALYQMGLARTYGEDQPMRLVWHYVQRDQLRTSTRTREQLDDLRRSTIDAIETIQRETEYPTTKSKLCSWCEYRDLCPLWNEGATPPAPRPTARPAPRAEQSGQLTLL